MKRVSDTFQLATFGENAKNILVGLQNFPAQDLALFYYEKDSSKVKEFSQNISSVLGITTSLWEISSYYIVQSVIEQVNKVIKMKKDNSKEILMNVGSGDKKIYSAALLAAYLNGIKVFDVDENYDLVLFPFLKLSYTEVVSDAKMRILQALDTAGGTTTNLENLSKISGLGKPLLSYHINGAQGSSGLRELGLIDVKKLQRCRTEITLNTLGRIFLSSRTQQEKFKKNNACISLRIGP